MLKDFIIEYVILFIHCTGSKKNGHSLRTTHILYTVSGGSKEAKTLRK